MKRNLSNDVLGSLIAAHELASAVTLAIASSRRWMSASVFPNIPTFQHSITPVFWTNRTTLTRIV